jgi:hypothetical protein
MTCKTYHEEGHYPSDGRELGSFPALNAQMAHYTGQTRALGRAYKDYTGFLTRLFMLSRLYANRILSGEAAIHCLHRQPE